MNRQRDFFEKLSHSWDGIQPAGRELKLEEMLVPFSERLAAARAVLEVGSGTGALIPLLTRFCPQAILVSIDLAAGMLQRARLRAPRARLVQTDTLALPFRAGQFSDVVCHNSFPHFARNPAALPQLRRALAQGGCLYILHDVSRERVNATHSGAPSDVIHHDLLPPVSILGEQLVQAGFSPICLEDDERHYAATAVRL